MSALFSNLILNSWDAVSDTGVIQIRSDVRNEQIVIEVEDDGRGIPHDKLAGIFEPSFVVSDRRVATGNWALFHCHTVVNSLGGEIHIDSTEGEGTTVRVALPIQ